MNAEDLSLADIIVYALVPAIIALATAIGFMYKQGLSRQKRTEDKLDECQAEHRETQKAMIELSGRVGQLEGYRDGVKDLAEAIIKKIDDAHAQVPLGDEPRARSSGT